ncbi:hypothetical protein [Streptomyces sp. NPDC002088]|uniref:hypothetical protein n=1 Tax=Streptomyces sp. NPDC002088 TaxID=3154665 RepID=UPI00331BC860
MRAGSVRVTVTGRDGVQQVLEADKVLPYVRVPEPTLAQQWDLTVHEAARTVYAHPTLGRTGAYARSIAQLLADAVLADVGPASPRRGRRPVRCEKRPAPEGHRR